MRQATKPQATAKLLSHPNPDVLNHRILQNLMLGVKQIDECASMPLLAATLTRCVTEAYTKDYHPCLLL